jgi:hypothetical protein
MTKTHDSPSHDKPCTLCSTPRPVLVRCQIDETEKWNFVCPGKCWREVSGGVEDAKGLEGKYPYYRYGGMVRSCSECPNRVDIASGKTSMQMALLVRRSQRKSKNVKNMRLLLGRLMRQLDVSQMMI